MDFFARQERSRRATVVLVALFALAFLAVVAATTLLVAVVAAPYLENGAWLLDGEGVAGLIARSGGSLLLVAAGVLAAILTASLYRTAMLARGGDQVARMMGGTEITGEGTDPVHRRLINVVEEMAIASGLPVPDIFVLEQEPGINAFAAGLAPENAAIAVTRGALERLNRAELQGVVAHEFSHILNGDMRLNQRLIGASFGILVLSLVGRWLLRSARTGRRGRTSGGTAAAVVLGLGLTIIGGIGVLLSRLIKAAVSRERERLADACAVQFTREPSGLAGALKKIAGHTSSFSAADAEEIAHMLFGRGSRTFVGWFATHPPLEERIRALEPSFDPRSLASTAPAATAAGAERAGAAALAPAAVPAATLLDRAGEIETAEVGEALRSALPEEIYHAAHTRDGSFLLVLALAHAADTELRRRQLALVERQLGAERAARVRTLLRELDALRPELKLPLVEIAVPALRRRPRAELEYLFELAGKVTALDGEERLFGYALLRLLEHYLLERAPARSRRLGEREAVERLLANVARVGQRDTAAANAAFAAGLAALGDTRERGSAAAAAENGAGASDAYAAASGSFADLDASLATLATLRPRAKRAVLAAVLATIRHDRHVAIEEAELFRAIAATLGCPLPPTAAI